MKASPISSEGGRREFKLRHYSEACLLIGARGGFWPAHSYGRGSGGGGAAGAAARARAAAVCGVAAAVRAARSSRRWSTSVWINPLHQSVSTEIQYYTVVEDTLGPLV
jgi:hypothetical protein